MIEHSASYFCAMPPARVQFRLPALMVNTWAEGQSRALYDLGDRCRPMDLHVSGIAAILSQRTGEEVTRAEVAHRWENVLGCVPSNADLEPILCEMERVLHRDITNLNTCLLASQEQFDPATWRHWKADLALDAFPERVRDWIEQAIKTRHPKYRKNYGPWRRAFDAYFIEGQVAVLNSLVSAVAHAHAQIENAACDIDRDHTALSQASQRLNARMADIRILSPRSAAISSGQDALTALRVAIHTQNREYDAALQESHHLSATLYRELLTLTPAAMSPPTLTPTGIEVLQGQFNLTLIELGIPKAEPFTGS
jgi:hypothetical protein